MSQVNEGVMPLYTLEDILDESGIGEEELLWRDKDTLATMTEKYNASVSKLFNTAQESHDFQLNLSKADVGLSNVDNTSDEDKPLSKAVRDALRNIPDLSQSLRIHKTVADMRYDSGLAAGASVVTIGSNDVNDGLSCLYNIVDKSENEELPGAIFCQISGLYAVPYHMGLLDRDSARLSDVSYAEYAKWSDDNPTAEERLGQVVTIGGNGLSLATSKNPIFGVTVASAAVIGNHSNEYINDPKMALVAIIGTVVVEDDGSCYPGVFAAPSDTKAGIVTVGASGYTVVSRVDYNHVKIALTGSASSGVDLLDVEHGGTGGRNPEQARKNLNAAANTAVTVDNDGLMLATDKNKLDNLFFLDSDTFIDYVLNGNIPEGWEPGASAPGVGVPGGSTSGTVLSYNDLTNKPQINSVPLQGNVTSHDLGVQDEGERIENSVIDDLPL